MPLSKVKQLEESTVLLRIVEFEPLITESDGFEMGALNCILEDGDVVTLYNIPLEITRAIAKLVRYDDLEPHEPDMRDTIYELLIMIQPKLTEFKESIEGVVIDGFNRTYGTYSASMYMNVDGISLKRTMIPSHAIFLALLFNKPVYVTAEVVKISKELEKEESDDEGGFFSSEDEDDEF